MKPLISLARTLYLLRAGTPLKLACEMSLKTARLRRPTVSINLQPLEPASIPIENAIHLPNGLATSRSWARRSCQAIRQVINFCQLRGWCHPIGEGQVIPLESTLEIKTRVIHKPLEIEEVAPQLWISQTLKLVQAYHSKGTFQRPEVKDVAALIKRWEERNQTDLKEMAALINQIRNVVKGCGGNAIVKYDVKEDKLVVWKIDGKKMLPKDLYSKWDVKDKSEVEINTGHDAGADSDVKPVDGVETKAEGKGKALCLV